MSQGTVNNNPEQGGSKPVKQDTLVSGTNIKTVNGESLLGSGNIVAGGGSFSGTMDDIPDGIVYVKSENNYTDVDASIVAGVTAALAGKAPSLGTDDNYVTDAEKVVIGNTSGTNTGDDAVNSLYSGLAASKLDVPTGTPDGTKYLRDDNTWQAVSGGSGLTQQQVEGIL